ncbi:hypothetical protein Scep_009593 [Stephania cephalantha]|uniref:Uncharacterized protein n=1 Tax=Stephania cephalantha TaxID=152367 RepID=A0AAP0PDB1_9MAGN
MAMDSAAAVRGGVRRMKAAVRLRKERDVVSLAFGIVGQQWEARTTGYKLSGRVRP